MPRSWLVLSLLLALLPGCRRLAPGAGVGSGGLSTAPAPLKTGPLVVEPVGEVAKKLVAAHYEPAALGLRELGFDVELRLKKTSSRATGTGKWKQGGGRPEVALREVERRGQREQQAADPGVGTQIWQSLRFQTEALLDGLGQGFLSRRLQEWQRLGSGKVALESGKLVLRFGSEGGETAVTVGEGYRVERVEHRSPKKINRTMTYEHQLEGGRNLVTRARLAVTIDEGSGMTAQQVTSLRSTDGMLFEIGYERVGGFLLPVRLRTQMKAPEEETVVTVRYTSAR